MKKISFLLFLTINSILSQSTLPSVAIQMNFKSPFETIKTHLSHTIYQKNAPTVPYYSYSAAIPNSGRYELKIHFLDSILLENVELPLSKGLEKKTPDTFQYDTAYFIESFDPEKDFPRKNYQSFQPFIVRQKRIKTFHIYPYKYNYHHRTLKIYTQLSIELIQTNTHGFNEIGEENYTEKIAYPIACLSSSFSPKYDTIHSPGDLLILYKNTADSLIKRFALWKQQTGIPTHLLKLVTTENTPEVIRQKIASYYDSLPQLLYVLLIGDENEIPPYLYKHVLNTDYYSDAYYGMLDGNDYVPELLVGRFSGNEEQNRILIDKTIAYEKFEYDTNYEKNLMLVGSDQGENIGNNGDLDWQHLRNIGVYLRDSAAMTPIEFYDGSQGELDADGNPSSVDIQNGINSGVGMLFYTGHGEFTSFTTGNFFTLQVKQLENYHQFPIIISAACDNGKFMGGLNCIGEVFNWVTKNNQPTGSVAFMGSSILMSWAPPMQTQVEFSRLINPNSVHFQPTLGLAFYNAQLNMLEHYPTTFGEEVMQTWILLGDPSLRMRINQKGKLQVTHPETIAPSTATLLFQVNENDAMLTLTQNDSVIASSVSNNHSVSFQNLILNSEFPIEITATKSNYITYLGTINFIQKTNENIATNWSIYPNPAKQSVSFLTENPVDNVELYDCYGKKISSTYDKSKKILILHVDSDGIYFIRFVSGGTYYSQKIQIKHD